MYDDNNLFCSLIDKGLNKTEFAREVGISSQLLMSRRGACTHCRQLDPLGDVASGPARAADQKRP